MGFFVIFQNMSTPVKKDQVYNDYEYKQELWRRQYHDKFYGIEDDSGQPQVSDAYADTDYMTKLENDRRNGMCNLI